MAAVCLLLAGAEVCKGQEATEAATSEILDGDPLAFDPNETGFLVGVAAGNINYTIDGDLGRWVSRGGGSIQTLNFNVLYRANPYLSFGIFQELSGSENRSGILSAGGDSIRMHTFKSNVAGLTLVGTIFPHYRVRVRGILNGLWAKQSLVASDYIPAQGQVNQCERDSNPPYETKCTPTWLGQLKFVDSHRDSQSRFGFGVGLGVEVQWFSRVRVMLDVSMRKLDDDYFGDSIHLTSTQKLWTLGLQYGPLWSGS